MCLQRDLWAQPDILRISCLSLTLPSRSESAESPDAAPSGVQAAEQPAVIPTQGDLLGDLLNLDLGPPVSGPPIATSSVQMGAVDLLGGGLDSLVCHSPARTFPCPASLASIMLGLMLAPLWSSWGWDRLVCPETPGVVLSFCGW